MPKTVSTKPYDWTYTTIYAGHEAEASSSSLVAMEAALEAPPEENVCASRSREYDTLNTSCGVDET